MILIFIYIEILTVCNNTILFLNDFYLLFEKNCNEEKNYCGYIIILRHHN